jgi:hypothetical protein
VKRTAEGNDRSSNLFSRPLTDLGFGHPASPSDESLGYFQSSANADFGETFLNLFSGTARVRTGKHGDRATKVRYSSLSFTFCEIRAVRGQCPYDDGIREL